MKPVIRVFNKCSIENNHCDLSNGIDFAFRFKNIQVTQMKITKAKQKDIDDVLELLGELFTQEVEFAFDRKLHTKGLKMILKDKKIGEIFIVKQKDKVIACLNILYTISTALGAKVALFEDIMVKQEFQSKGIGTKLLQKALHYLTKKKIKRVTLLTDGDNFRAHQFYQKIGFIPSTMKPFRLRMQQPWEQ